MHFAARIYVFSFFHFMRRRIRILHALNIEFFSAEICGWVFYHCENWLNGVLGEFLFVSQHKIFLSFFQSKHFSSQIFHFLEHFFYFSYYAIFVVHFYYHLKDFFSLFFETIFNRAFLWKHNRTVSRTKYHCAEIVVEFSFVCAPRARRFQ